MQGTGIRDKRWGKGTGCVGKGRVSLLRKARLPLLFLECVRRIETAFIAALLIPSFLECMPTSDKRHAGTASIHRFLYRIRATGVNDSVPVSLDDGNYVCYVHSDALAPTW